MSPSLPVPQKFRTHLTYATYFSQAATLGRIDYKYAGNGCFDPDLTGAGHQPYTWDQLTAIYKFYTVTSSTIELQLLNDTGTKCIGVAITPVF